MTVSELLHQLSDQPGNAVVADGYGNEITAVVTEPSQDDAGLSVMLCHDS